MAVRCFEEAASKNLVICGDGYRYYCKHLAKTSATPHTAESAFTS